MNELFISHNTNIFFLYFQKKIKLTNGNARGKSSGRKSIANKSIIKDSTSNEAPTGKASDTQSWPHLKYDFLQPGKIKDKQKRSSDHPDYDPKTVYVPQDFLNNQTPVRTQQDFGNEKYNQQ